MHPQRPLPLHRRPNRPLMRSVFCRPAASAAMPPRTMSAAVPSSLAPHDSKARLISATNSRRFVAKPRTPHPIPQAAQLFKCRSANVRGRGARPLVLSLGGLRGILSFEKESIPPTWQQRAALHLPSAQRAEPSPFSCLGKQKAPAGIGEGFLLCCVCIFRREKITSGGVPLCKY